MVERVATLLDEQPSLSANQVAALLRLRRQDAQRIVRTLRAAAGRFPKSEGRP